MRFFLKTARKPALSLAAAAYVRATTLAFQFLLARDFQSFRAVNSQETN